MPMNRTERETIENIIRRLKKPNCGGSFFHEKKAVEALRAIGLHPEYLERGDGRIDEIAIVSRIYLDTWIIPALEMILSDNPSDKRVAWDLSR